MSIRRSVRQAKPNATPRESLIDRLLDPIDRLSETVYTVLIALIFTLAYRIFHFGGETGPDFSSGYGTELFFAILGAAVAWGVIDGIMYAMMEVFARSERHGLLYEIQSADAEETAVSVIADELDFILEPITSDDQRQALYLDILSHLREGRPQAVGLQREDVFGALGSVLIAVSAITPSLLPFLLLPANTALAIRISNVVSFVVLFGAGYRWGQYTGTSPWKTGLILAGVGLLMVLIAIPLGG